jgi:hypothetical protein
MPAIACRASLNRLTLVGLGLLLLAGPGRGGPLPATVDLRPRFEEWGLTVNDQGKRGTCVLQAMTALLEYEHATRGTRGLRLSVDYLVWAARDVTGRQTEDSWFPGVLAALNRHGACGAELMPYAPRFNPAARPSAQARADARSRTGVVADWARPVENRMGMTLVHLRRVKEILAAGHPIAAAFHWPKKLVFTAEYTLEVPPRSGVGGIHAIVLVGYADDARQPGGGVFLLRNSWGPKWGKGGYARMPYAYAAAYGRDAVSLRVGQAVKEVTNRTAVALHKAEDMPVVHASGGAAVKEDLSGWGKGRWNRDSHLVCGGGAGGAVVLRLRVVRAGTYRVDFYGTRAPDYSRVRVTLDDQPLGGVLNAYAPAVEPTGRVPLGARWLKVGNHLLRVAAVGKDRESLGYRFGIDGIDLVPAGR